MKKVDVSNKLAEVRGLTKQNASEILDEVLEIIKNGLVEDGVVDIYGFGKFTVKEVSEKSGVIQLGDRKGETYTTPAHKAPAFKFAKPMKELVK